MKQARRIRPRLLVLLWIWAVLMFVVVDLFRNVSEFDRIRPQARVYRAMRYSAHKLVGESYTDGDFAETLPARTVARSAPPVAVTDAEVLREMLGNVQRAETFDDLRDHVTRRDDVRVRKTAMRRLASRFGREAQATLIQVVRDRSDGDRARAEAACALGRTGASAFVPLDDILRSGVRPTIKRGAVLGLGELSTAEAAERALALAKSGPPVLRKTAREAIRRMSGEGALYVLTPAACDGRHDIETRVAACRALAATKNVVAVQTLSDLLARPGSPEAVREAAADGLGRMGHVSALPTVTAACRDPSPQVSRQARIARSRLAHVR